MKYTSKGSIRVGIRVNMTLIALPEQVMPHSPRFAPVKAEELCTRQEEDPEPIKARSAFLSSRSCRQSVFLEGLDTRSTAVVLVLEFEPVFQGSRVVPPVDPPVPLEHHVLLEVCEQIKGRHGTAYEMG